MALLAVGVQRLVMAHGFRPHLFLARCVIFRQSAKIPTILADASLIRTLIARHFRELPFLWRNRTQLQNETRFGHST